MYVQAPVVQIIGFLVWSPARNVDTEQMNSELTCWHNCMSRLPIMSITNDFVFTWANSGCKCSRRTTDPVSGRQYSFFFLLSWLRQRCWRLCFGRNTLKLSSEARESCSTVVFYAGILIRSRLVYAQHPDANVHQNVTDMYRLAWHYKLSTCFLFQFILCMWKQYVHAGKQQALEFQFIIIVALIDPGLCVPQSLTIRLLY